MGGRGGVADSVQQSTTADGRDVGVAIQASLIDGPLNRNDMPRVVLDLFASWQQ